MAMCLRQRRSTMLMSSMELEFGIGLDFSLVSRHLIWLCGSEACGHHLYCMRSTMASRSTRCVPVAPLGVVVISTDWIARIAA